MKNTRLKLIFFVVAVFIAGLVLFLFQIYQSWRIKPVGPGAVANINDSGIAQPEEKDKFPPGVKHTVPLNLVVGGGPPREGITAIDKPQFESVLQAAGYLADESLGIFVSSRDKVRFYPFQILVWHEVVNDQIDALPVVVTYCPLCGVSAVYVRKIGLEQIELVVSNKVYNNTLVMLDKQGANLINQIDGEVIVGEAAGARLDAVPFDKISWRDFKNNYPNGQVLSRETGFRRDYTFDPYGDYYGSSNIYYSLTALDQRFHPKTPLHGLIINDKPKAYIDSKVKKAGLINDEIGGSSVVIWVDPATGAIRFCERRGGERDLSFEIKNGRLFDHQTNSTWNFLGESSDGRLKKSKLKPLVDVTAYWFVWFAFNPSTIVWGL